MIVSMREGNEVSQCSGRKGLRVKGGVSRWKKQRKIRARLEDRGGRVTLLKGQTREFLTVQLRNRYRDGFVDLGSPCYFQIRARDD